MQYAVQKFLVGRRSTITAQLHVSHLAHDVLHDYTHGTPDITLSQETVDLLKPLARPLEDTYDSLIERLARVCLERDFGLLQAHASQSESRNGLASRDPSVEMHVRKMTPATRDVFEQVCNIVYDIDPRTTIHRTQEYVGCRINANNFAAIFSQRNGLVVWFRPEATEGLGPGEHAVLHGVSVDRPAKSPWRNDARMKVASGTDMDGVRELLRRSYEAIR